MLNDDLNKLCQLCTADEGLLCRQEVEEIDRLTSLFNFEIDEQLSICENCFHVLHKFSMFSERCMKAKEFFEYLRSLENLPADLESVRVDLGVRIEKVNQSTDTDDLSLDIKNELDDPECQHDEDDMNAFEELENFEEISTIELTNDVNENQYNEMTIEVVNLKVENNEEDCDDAKSTTEISNKTNCNSTFDFSCHLCDEKFHKFFPLQAHCRKDHQSCPEVVCPCGTTLKSRVTLAMHKKMHNFGSETHPCKLCKKIYSQKNLLANHVRISHSKTEKFTCPQCQKCFDNIKKLKSHEYVHLPHDTKFSSSCPYCDKKFTKSVNMQAHIRSIHQMQRPFLCCDCGKDFTTKGALKEHQIIHSNDFPHQCNFCQKKFKNMARLKTHEDTHNKTQYICNVCGISLNTKRTLKMHMVVHSDQKKFKCQYCGSSFKRSKALKNHLILHSGLRPYACLWCDKTFANGSNFRSHKKKTHPVELAAYESSGKATPNSNLSIPRLDQLQPKTNATASSSTAITSTEMNQQQTTDTHFVDIKQELPPLMIPASSDNFQIHHIIQSSNSILVDSQTQ